MKQGTKIVREDMLELTRRMTIKRNCFDRIAGAYLDEEGYIDGTFNIHFLKLSGAEKSKNLEIAKAIPFASTNEELVELWFEEEEEKPGGVWQMLMAIRESELKNDGLLELFYEWLAEQKKIKGPYGIYFFHGNYDIPLKGSDKEAQRESEEVYRFVLCAICPLIGEYEPGEPVGGFLFPAFKDRSTDLYRINVFQKK